jgi:hypothetical protein
MMDMKNIFANLQGAYFCKEAVISEEDVITFTPACLASGNQVEETFGIHQTDDGLFIHDYGLTLANLDSVFELGETDVIKNLVAIMRQHNIGKAEKVFIYKIDTADSSKTVNQQIQQYLQGIYFMYNMKLFYV